MQNIDDTELVGRIMDATERGRVEWQKTAAADQYAATFAGKWTLLIDKARDTGDIEEYFWLSIDNSEGETILRIYSPGEPRLSRLFELARRHALNVGEAISDILNGLDN